jgi:septation ring formation regulator EzrA
MDIDIENISEEQNRFIQSYKRINERLETLQKQMTLIQYETQELLNELEELRNLETKTYKNGKK